ncbi:MAG: adenosylcobinamide-GDP ribazoletransferase [Paracoccaceae bacterium]
MAQSDTPLMLLHDIAASLGLLTRLPIAVNTDLATRRGAAAAWAWPLAGAMVGALAWAAGGLALALGTPPALAAGAALITATMVTGAMHEDGLADTADGFWGGWTIERRLAIMKDSHIGSYGVMALILITGLRWQALGAIFAATSAPWAIIGIAALSRVPMAALMAMLPNARGSGLAQSVGRPSARTALLAATVGLALAVIGLGWLALPATLGVALVSLALAGVAKSKIGGQTGDILGASQQLAEMVALLVVAAAL